ncbi:MAG: Trm112 family protein [Planctomycetota bacterium]
MSDAPAPSHSPSAEPAIDAELLAILVCPLTRSPLRQEGSELVAEVGGLRYPIRDGIPVLLVHEATLPDTVTSLDDFKQRYAEHIPDAG